MDQRIKKLLGEGPYPFSTDQVNNEGPIETFTGRTMIILTQKCGLDMPKGGHTHSSYEFSIPLSEMSTTSLENKPVAFEKDKLFPINAEQFHGFLKPTSNCQFLTFQIDKDTLNDISMQFCNKGNVSFVNESVSVGSGVSSLLKMFMTEAKYMQNGIDLILNNITNLIVLNLLRELKSNLPTHISEKNYCERDNINRAINYLRDQYNNNFSLEDIANVANLSPFHFIRIFKATTGKTPYNYLLDIKIEKAKELLVLKKHTITEICFLCGFNNLEHFSSVFKRKVGLLPSQYRKLKI